MFEQPTFWRYALTIEYDGNAFAGFQVQPNAYTVQQALEEAIEARFHEKRRIIGAGRTDAGVHAKGQVVIFDFSKKIDPQKVISMINSACPKALRVIKAKMVAKDWHPRHCSKHKTYAYYIYDRGISSPLLEKRVYQLKYKLDINHMRQAANVLIGVHDFASFQASGCSAQNTIRKIKKITISRIGSLIICRFQGNAFLYHMVRNMVGTLINIGLGKCKAKEIKHILDSKDRRLAGPTAPAYGLVLEKIVFGRKK